VGKDYALSNVLKTKLADIS